jgi:hypothetical protein
MSPVIYPWFSWDFIDLHWFLSSVSTTLEKVNSALAPLCKRDEESTLPPPSAGDADVGLTLASNYFTLSYDHTFTPRRWSPDYFALEPVTWKTYPFSGVCCEKEDWWAVGGLAPRPLDSLQGSMSSSLISQGVKISKGLAFEGCCELGAPRV